MRDLTVLDRSYTRKDRQEEEEKKCHVNMLPNYIGKDTPNCHIPDPPQERE